jgi:hypothetical protein
MTSEICLNFSAFQINPRFLFAIQQRKEVKRRLERKRRSLTMATKMQMPLKLKRNQAEVGNDTRAEIYPSPLFILFSWLKIDINFLDLTTYPLTSVVCYQSYYYVDTFVCQIRQHGFYFETSAIAPRPLPWAEGNLLRLN